MTLSKPAKLPFQNCNDCSVAPHGPLPVKSEGEQDMTTDQLNYKQRAIAILRKRAADLDCELVPLQKAA